jgi:hypothetical protein
MDQLPIARSRAWACAAANRQSFCDPLRVRARYPLDLFAALFVRDRLPHQILS